MQGDYYTFSNGAEARDWKWRNCERCAKGYDDDKGAWRCDLERAVDDSMWTHSLMDGAAAERIGYSREPYGHLTDCKEREHAAREVEPRETGVGDGSIA